ncbi:zinc finger protein 567-like isoform X2 [Aricia agestis]|uniref:zinc finger protein 567-like isoform X2 n=1 Tax=Aricia agestis TaxID=91739 RepID=UPI001C20990D|nr:zinc finger protein 567-like isoform X2 [Aricia agestis]
MEQASCLVCFHPSKNVSDIVNNNLWNVCEQLAEIKIEEKVELAVMKQSDLVNYSVPKYYADQINEESKDSIGPVPGTSEKTYQRKINSKSLENQLPSPDTNSDENVVLRRCLYIVDKPRKKIKNLFSQVMHYTEVDPLLTTTVPLETSTPSDSEIPLPNDIISTPNVNSSSFKNSLLESSNIKSEPPKKKIMQSGNIYPCKKCAMEFIYKSRLQWHNAHCHPRVRKTYNCKFCGKNCQSKQNLISHTRVHTGEKPYECAECGGCFISKQTLTRHILVTHRKHKPYVCQTCGKAFPEKAPLRVHERTHTGEKPYACHCGVSFANIRTFHLHFRSGAHHRRLYFLHRNERIPCVSVPDVLNKVTKGLARYDRWPKSASCTAGTTETTPTVASPTGTTLTETTLRETTLTETTPTDTTPTDTTPSVTTPKETTQKETTPTLTTRPKTKHPEERLHCPFCGATCGDKCRLRSHMRVHLMFEVGQFPCPVCCETCTSLDHLVIHLDYHPDSDSCQTCNVTFVNSRDMKRHIGIFHANTI